MKITATKVHDDGYVLEISPSEAELFLQIREALDGEGSDVRNHPLRHNKLNFEGDLLLKTLLGFLQALRSQNDFTRAFSSLKEIVDKESA